MSMTTIGASQIAALFHCSPWLSEYSLWAQMVGLAERQEDTPRLKIGRLLEKTILLAWADENEMLIRHNTQTFVRGECSATPDGEEPCEIGETPAYLAEVKTVEPARRRDWDNGTPLYYVLQCQQQMLVRGAPVNHLVAQFGFHTEPAEQTIVADPEVQAEIVKRVATFMQRVRGELPPPEVDGHDATTAALRQQAIEPDKIISLGNDVREWSDVLSDKEAAAKVLGKEASALRNKIRAALGAAQFGCFSDGSGWKLTQIAESKYETTRKAHQRMTRTKNGQAEEGDE